VRLGRLALLHPFPTVLVAAATGVLGLVAGAGVESAAIMAVSMAGFQAAIGTVNDLVDAPSDAVGQPWKPIPAGRVSRRVAEIVALTAAALGVVGSAALGAGTLVVGLAGLGLGLAYDMWAKRAGWGWLCLTLALPLVPVYAWLGAGAGLPPDLGLLVVMAVLAGVELAIANGLVDLAADTESGSRSIAVRLGPSRGRLVMVAAAAALIGLAWLTGVDAADRALGPALPLALGLMAVGSALLLLGVIWSARRGERGAWRGWHVQTVGVAGLAIGWFVLLAAEPVAGLAA
jgi:4-hydroxybenzoate polyprenyltransferase